MGNKALEKKRAISLSEQLNKEASKDKPRISYVWDSRDRRKATTNLGNLIMKAMWSRD